MLIIAEAAIVMELKGPLVAPMREHQISDGGIEFTRKRHLIVTESLGSDTIQMILLKALEHLLNTIIVNTVYTNMTTDDLLDALDIAMDVKGIPDVKYGKYVIEENEDKKYYSKYYA